MPTSDNPGLARHAYVQDEKVTEDLGVEGQWEGVTDPKSSSPARGTAAGEKGSGLFECRRFQQIGGFLSSKNPSSGLWPSWRF